MTISTVTGAILISILFSAVNDESLRLDQEMKSLKTVLAFLMNGSREMDINLQEQNFTLLIIREEDPIILAGYIIKQEE